MKETWIGVNMDEVLAKEIIRRANKSGVDSGEVLKRLAMAEILRQRKAAKRN